MRLIALLLCALFTTGTAAQSPFPLRIADGGRHFVDARGRPFFYQADTAWFLFLKLSLTEVAAYFAHRKRQGFNVIQVMLTGVPAERNLYGEPAFLGDTDLTRPNERYFARVDSIVALAAEHELLLAMTPLWSSCCRDGYAGELADGSAAAMNVHGPAATRAFGTWLAERYAAVPNVVWILGGDNDPYNALPEIEALAAGLRAVDTPHLLTYHAASTHSSTDVFPVADWLDFSMVYTYFRGFDRAWNRVQPDVYEVAHAAYHKPGALPFILGESTYEGEHGALGSALQARKQAYWVAFGGGAGHAYGSPNWHLRDDWRAVLDYPGAQSLQHLPPLLERHDWTTLRPDRCGALSGYDRTGYAANDYAVSLYDARTVLHYLPSARRVQLDLRSLRAGRWTLSWYDPRTGRSTPVGRYRRNRLPALAPPGEGDWVLVAKRDG